LIVSSRQPALPAAPSCQLGEHHAYRPTARPPLLFARRFACEPDLCAPHGNLRRCHTAAHDQPRSGSHASSLQGLQDRARDRSRPRLDHDAVETGVQALRRPPQMQILLVCARSVRTVSAQASGGDFDQAVFARRGRDRGRARFHTESLYYDVGAVKDSGCPQICLRMGSCHCRESLSTDTGMAFTSSSIIAAPARAP